MYVLTDSLLSCSVGSWCLSSSSATPSFPACAPWSRALWMLSSLPSVRLSLSAAVRSPFHCRTRTGIKRETKRLCEPRRESNMAQYKGAASEAGRAMQLMKKREKEREQLEQLKLKIAEDNMVKSNIDKKFSAHYDAVEAELKSSTVGLVTLNDMKAKQEALVKEREKQLAKKEQSKELQLNTYPQNNWSYSHCFLLQMLHRHEEVSRKKYLGKNPDVDTSFLPDRDREEEENRLREELRQEWELKQEKIKSEEIEITFSYWDGSGHRKTVKMKKGNTIQNFLQRALEVLRKDFSELRSAGVEQLMYIKEDLIIPHHHSFYDFIVTKARGKSGPLFSFDVHDDIRLVNDATVEKDESHAGKVVLRSWYEKNKHIFPASRWEPYDPEKKWDKYTVRACFCIPSPVSPRGSFHNLKSHAEVASRGQPASCCGAHRCSSGRLRQLLWSRHVVHHRRNLAV
uniref:Family with sequence similarity 50 member A n=1 Tax=Cyclopterus lumpus TaxID=8103 RepID=A0A8C2XCM3_CYCLU